MSPADVVKAVREKLEDPKRWLRNRWATNGRNQQVLSASPKAKRWDLAGAFNSVAATLPKDQILNWYHARQYVAATIIADYGDCSLIEFNDDPEVDHKYMLRILDFAVEQLEH